MVTVVKVYYLQDVQLKLKSITGMDSKDMHGPGRPPKCVEKLLSEVPKSKKDVTTLIPNQKRLRLIPRVIHVLVIIPVVPSQLIVIYFITLKSLFTCSG